MGLLDFSGFVGDDTAKDEFGQTQADRRQPLFSGLLKAGMLGMAAGENITPGARAQLMANMGGAIAGIPEAMNQQKAEVAQMQLRRQQFATNKQKLDQARELQAYAQTPEFVEMLKGMPSHIQLGLNAMIKAGDADGFQRLMSSYQAAQTAQAETLRKEKRDDAKADAAAKKEADKGQFGNSLEGIHAQNLGSAPRDSYAYWAAHTFYTTDKVVNGVVVPKTNLPKDKFPDPTYAGPKPADPNAPAAPAAPPAAPAPAPVVIAPNVPVDADVAAKVGAQLDPGQSRDVNGVLIEKDKSGNTVWNDDAYHYRLTPKGGVPERIALKPPPEPDKAALSTFNVGLTNIDLLTKELDTKDVRLGPANKFISALPFGPDLLAASNPEGRTARALIAGLTSAKIKEQSGANVTDAEFKRLDQYLPKDGDTLPQIREKLEGLKREMESVARDRYLTLPPETRMNPEWRQRFGAKPAAAAEGEKKWKIGDKWTDSAGRKWIVASDGTWKADQ